MHNARRVYLSLAENKLKRMTEIVIIKYLYEVRSSKFYSKVLVLLNLDLIDKRRRDIDNCLS